jgi:hypothetical protein
MELELGVFSVARKLVEDIVHVWRWNIEKEIFSLPTSYPNSK